MSNLEKHAEDEMRRAGLYDKDSDYGGMIPEAVMKLVKVHAEERHSGGSHSMVLGIFNRVVSYKTLTPLTDDPEEWTQVGPDMMPDQAWQNRRSSSCFSKDGGKTWYDIDEKKEEGKPFTIHTSEKHETQKEKLGSRPVDSV